MSFHKKIITTYSKSLFQKINNENLKKNLSPIIPEIQASVFDLDSLVSSQKNDVPANIYVVGEELSFLSSILESSTKIKRFFNNPTLLEEQKLEALLTLFPGLSLITISFLKVLTEKSHLCLLPEIAFEYNELLFKFKKITKIKLITASRLEENYGLLLNNTLKKLTKSNEIILKVSYNPQLLGGFILEYNSTSTDGSLLKEFSLFFNEN